MVAIEGSQIKSWGFSLKTVKFGENVFEFKFILVTTPILGADLFAHFSLLVSPKTKEVIFEKTNKPLIKKTNQFPIAAASTDARTADLPLPIKQLFQRHPAVLDSSGRPHPTHGVEHVIETTGRPVFAKARRLDQGKLLIAEAEFRNLQDSGIIRPSNSPWASPLHLVPKKDGTFRPCGDYRRLNNITTPDRYPLPNIQDLSARLHNCKVFTKLDLVRGYHQVQLAESDIPKTAIVTPFGLFEYVFMPFGLKTPLKHFND